MQVGTTILFTGLGGPEMDRKVYDRDLRLADLAEPLGFDSIWGVEHHFTDYTMSPNPLHFLAYMAGRTKRIHLGTMAMVLPWHQNPMRVAEEAVLLDHLSGGRLILGVARGLGRIEFEGFGLNQADSRETFREAAQMIVAGLESGYCEANGKFVKQARRAIRPAPFKTFHGRTYAAAVSPESSEMMATLGLGLLLLAQKPWEHLKDELENYRRIFRDVHKVEAPPPICAVWIYVDEDSARGKALGRKYIGDYYIAGVNHYELNKTHLSGTKGYETYASMQQMANSDGGLQKMVDGFVNNHAMGSADEVFEQIRRIRECTGADTVLAVFSYAGIGLQEAERNQRLFADKVLPRLKALPNFAGKAPALAVG